MYKLRHICQHLGYKHSHIERETHFPQILRFHADDGIAHAQDFNE